MKNLSLPVIFTLLASAVFAYAPHPTVVTVAYKGKMVPVVSMQGTNPIIVVKGEKKRIRTEPTYVFDRASAYADNRIEFSKLSLDGASDQYIYITSDDVDADLVPGGLGSGVTYIEATLKSEKALKGGFVAIVIYSLENLTEPASRYNRTEIIVRELPDLPAGQDVEFKFRSKLYDGGIGARYFVQTFNHEGREIPSNVMSKSWRYYSLRDREQLKSILSNYVEKNSGADRGVVPVVMPKPFLPKDTVPPESPLEAILEISAEGLVTKVNLIGLAHGALHSAIADALEGWLFLPRLEGGKPVAAKVQVPIKF